jgi:hypothetical protein
MVELDRVQLRLEIGDDVHAEARAERKHIRAIAAGQSVVAWSSDQRIGAVAGADDVVAGAAIDDVLAIAGGEIVLLAGAGMGLAAIAPTQVSPKTLVTVTMMACVSVPPAPSETLALMW